jgi:hypothetical protein
MEKFQEYRELAIKKLKIADHILTVTFPLVKDTRLLLGVIENLFLSLTYSMSSILYYERLFKRIPPFHDNFESKFNMFKERCFKKYNLNPEFISLIKEIKELIILHKKSPVEFTRKDSFVICNGYYRIKTIKIDLIKRYKEKTNLFLEETKKITSKNEDIFISV